jgi:hypothetical protein
MTKLFFVLLTILTLSCHTTILNEKIEKGVVASDYMNSFTDTSNIVIENMTYKQMCDELGILGCMPDSNKLVGNPNSFIENISEVANWSKEDSKKLLKESNGRFYLDTADRDFEISWYNQIGQLIKYESKKFSDMRHNEILLSYQAENSIAKIEIIDVVTKNLKYRNRTVKIRDNKFVTILVYNSVKTSP